MKYTPETIKSICGSIEKGIGRVDACAMADISYETFTKWMLRPEFVEAIKKAEAECKGRNIMIIQKAAMTTWQAAAWWLERKFPDEYALRQRHEITGKDGSPIQTSTVNLSKLSDEVLLKLAAMSDNGTAHTNGAGSR